MIFEVKYKLLIREYNCRHVNLNSRKAFNSQDTLLYCHDQRFLDDRFAIKKVAFEK